MTPIVEAGKVHERMIWVEEGDGELDQLSHCIKQSIHAFHSAIFFDGRMGPGNAWGRVTGLVSCGTSSVPEHAVPDRINVSYIRVCYLFDFAI